MLILPLSLSLSFALNGSLSFHPPHDQQPSSEGSSSGEDVELRRAPSPSTSFCKIKLKNFPPRRPQPSPTFLGSHAVPGDPNPSRHVPPQHSDVARLSSRSIFASKPCLKIFIYTGRAGGACGVNPGRHVAEVSVPLDLAGAQGKQCVFHNGWISVGKGAGKESSFHLNVKAEPDPRFVFQFEGSLSVVLRWFRFKGVSDNRCRNTGDRTMRSRSLPPETSVPRSWLNSFGSERERPGKERKGWSITVLQWLWRLLLPPSWHLLEVTVSAGQTPVLGSSSVRGRHVEAVGETRAWRERGGATDGLGYRFELIPDGSSGAGIVLTESSISSHRGGKFSIELGSSPTAGSVSRTRRRSGGSGDYGYGLWLGSGYKGFVMSASVEGEGKCSKPCVEVSVQHVSCMEDAAAYVALSAAIDLSMDACRLFNQRMRKELCSESSLG
ncbi:hypothetical protein HID58_090621 [Brassica napus]|uniref:Uncharacterized protein n=1 Tax=Brassica napus TaxID=3708 RepID=A0ABQ7XCY1_BRANA|nr:hypothetical protein HID58_090621 [Brassica napus]